MQIGVVTVGGRQVGVVTQSEDGDGDTFAPDFGDYEHQGHDWRGDLALAPNHPHAPHGPHAHVSHDHGHAAHTGDRAHHHTSRGTPPASDDGIGEGLTGSAYLAARRQRFADEMRNNPDVREQVAGMLLTEGARDPVPVAESLMNRMDYSGNTVQRGLHSGFYGPINRGELPGAISELRRNPELNARMNRAIDTALGGSNLIRGATDQGLPTDPNGQWQGGRMIRGGNVFNDWGGGPGGHAGSSAYRQNLMQHVEQERAAGVNEPSPETQGPPIPPPATATPAADIPRDHPEIHRDDKGGSEPPADL